MPTNNHPTQETNQIIEINNLIPFGDMMLLVPGLINFIPLDPRQRHSIIDLLDNLISQVDFLGMNGTVVRELEAEINIHRNIMTQDIHMRLNKLIPNYKKMQTARNLIELRADNFRINDILNQVDATLNFLNAQCRTSENDPTLREFKRQINELINTQRIRMFLNDFHCKKLFDRLNQIPQLEYDLSTFVFILVAMMSISPLLFGPVGFFDNPYTGEMELFLIFAISISIFYVID